MFSCLAYIIWAATEASANIGINNYLADKKGLCMYVVYNKSEKASVVFY